MINLPHEIVRLAEYFDESYPLYLVGGAVRNYLLGYDMTDYDVAGAATVDEVKRYLDGSDYNIIAEYKRTGTVVIGCGGLKVEYTTFREDSYPVDSGCHSPLEVGFTRDIAVDAMRRDFTCNALYYHILRGNVVDLVGGVADIEHGVLRAVRGEETMREDALRIMRMVRFALQLGFDIDNETMSAAKAYAINIADISAERIHDELMLILSAYGKNMRVAQDKALPSRGLRLLTEVGVMEYIIPELLEGIGVAQNERYHRYDVYEHILHTVDNCPSHLRLAGLLHDIAKPSMLRTQGNMYRHEVLGEEMSREILTRLKFSNREIEHTSRLVGIHMFNLDNQARDSKVRRFIVDNAELIDDYISLRIADGMASRVENFDRSGIDRLLSVREDMRMAAVPMSVRDMDISGRDLILLGYSGVEIGNILDTLWAEQVAKGVRYEREYMIDRYRR